MSLRFFFFSPCRLEKVKEALDLRKLILSLVMLVERKTVFYVNQQIYLSTQQSQDSQQLIC